MTTYTTLADLFFGLTMAVIGISLPFFILFRHDPLFRQRSYPLEFMWMFQTGAHAIRFRYIIISIATNHPWPCLVTIWNSGIQTPLWAFSGLIRCIRLYMMYSIAKEKFRTDQLNQENENAVDLKVPTRWWLNPKYLHWKYMFLLYFSMVLVFQVFPFATTIAGVSTAHDDGIVPQHFCVTPAGRSGSIGTIACLAIIILFLAYQMRNVHDAFFIKKEMNLLCFETFFVAAPSLISTFLTPWGWIGSLITMFVFSITSFLIPSILALKSRFVEYSTKGSSSEFSEDTGNSRQSRGGTVKINGFREYPRVQRLLNNSAALPWIQEYLVHYQDFELSNQLLCWTNIVKFKEAGNSGVAGRAWLLYKKFIENGSYIYVSCISETARNNLATVLSAEIQEDQEEKRPESTEVTVDVFNDVLVELEENLSEKLFKPFFKSVFFVKHQEELALKIGMDA